MYCTSVVRFQIRWIRMLLGLVKHSILSGSNPLADLGCESWLFKKAEFEKFISVLRIHIGFNADPDTFPDPAFFVMRIQIQGFDDQKSEKTLRIRIQHFCYADPDPGF